MRQRNGDVEEERERGRGEEHPREDAVPRCYRRFPRAFISLRLSLICHSTIVRSTEENPSVGRALEGTYLPGQFMMRTGAPRDGAGTG